MDSPQAIKNQVASAPIQNTFLPYWAKIKDGIIFRGTYHELKSQELIVKLYSSDGFPDTLVGQKIIPLRDVIDVSFARTDMVIHRSVVEEFNDDEDLNRPA